MHCSLFETEVLYIAMVIDVVALKEPILDFKNEIPAAEMNLDEEKARLAKPVQIAGKLRKGIAQIDIEGRITGEIEIECDRCLKHRAVPLDVPFKVGYVAEEHYTEQSEAELRADDLDVDVYDGERIDLTELAREQILLNLSERFLCREDCRGLCPKCGADRNAVNCDCEEKEIDPRWQGLRELKIKD